MINDMDKGILVLIIILSILLLFVILGVISFQVREFSRELKYLNCEIDRTSGREREYWIRKKRKLWLSLIPFVKY